MKTFLKPSPIVAAKILLANICQFECAPNVALRLTVVGDYDDYLAWRLAVVVPADPHVDPEPGNSCQCIRPFSSAIVEMRRLR